MEPHSPPRNWAVPNKSHLTHLVVTALFTLVLLQTILTLGRYRDHPRPTLTTGTFRLGSTTGRFAASFKPFTPVTGNWASARRARLLAVDAIGQELRRGGAQELQEAGAGRSTGMVHRRRDRNSRESGEQGSGGAETRSGERATAQHISGPEHEGKGSKRRSKNWIVVTSINHPSTAVRRLAAASANGWQLVVVGDHKTPKNWSLDGVVFLGVAEQARLGFEIHDLLPYGSYSRKNLGYLYAIQHGAEVIYDTDDDNILLDWAARDPWLGFLANQTLPLQALEYMARPDRRAVNPYVHFGQPTMWPRGLPLDRVAWNSPEGRYLQADASRKPLIQQGLANGDPDVDAVFRLTRATKGEKIRVAFDGSAPPVALPRGIMAPINSQNTLFLRDALWALRLPVTTTFRVCDIWRGYWAQRLLWDLGGALVFLPPTVFQERNIHDYFDDFVDEIDMYSDAGRLLDFLSRWSSPKPFFFDRALDLANDMVAEGFWGAKDAVLTAAWLRDLLRVGYQPPQINDMAHKRLRRVVKYEPKALETINLRARSSATAGRNSNQGQMGDGTGKLALSRKA